MDEQREREQQAILLLRRVRTRPVWRGIPFNWVVFRPCDWRCTRSHNDDNQTKIPIGEQGAAGNGFAVACALTFALEISLLLFIMALFKVILKEGEPVTFRARDYFELDGYTIFITEEVKDVAIETKLIEGIQDITNVQSTFTPFFGGSSDEDI